MATQIARCAHLTEAADWREVYAMLAEHRDISATLDGVDIALARATG